MLTTQKKNNNNNCDKKKIDTVNIPMSCGIIKIIKQETKILGNQ